MKAERVRALRGSLFPLTTAVAAGLALVLVPWIAPFGDIPDNPSLFKFLGLLAAIAVPTAMVMGSVRVRNRRVRWSGFRYLVAAGGAILAASVALEIVLNVVSEAAHVWEVPTIAETPLLAIVVILFSSLSGWFALQFQRWADRADGTDRPHRSPWDPRSWGLVGVAGGAVALEAFTIASWIAIRLGERIPGPSGAYSYARTWVVLTMIVATFALGAVVLEIDYRRDRAATASGNPPRLP